jgi:hypothetical protein
VPRARAPKPGRRIAPRWALDSTDRLTVRAFRLRVLQVRRALSAIALKESSARSRHDHAAIVSAAAEAGVSQALFGTTVARLLERTLAACIGSVRLGGCGRARARCDLFAACCAA